MLFENKLWLSDIDKVIEFLPELESLDRKSILITGATGLICSAVVELLLRYNDTHNHKCRVIAAGRAYEKIQDRFKKLVDRDDFEFIQYDATKYDNIIETPVDFIIHGASNATPKAIVCEPVETMVSNFLGVKSLLDYAKKAKTKRVLFISSSEVYGNNDNDKPYLENQYGYIDLLKSRNSYSVSKRAAETLCASYADEYGVDSVIVRPGHIYGPTASPNDNRVSSAWAFSAARGEDIVMKSDGAQVRSYCYCLDCASAILKVLLVGRNGCAYNISNPDSIVSIRKMAELLAKFANVNLKREIPTELEKKGFNPMSNSSLDSTSLLELGWRGCFDANMGFLHTVEILKDQCKDSEVPNA